MLFDTHAHLLDEKFQPDWAQVMQHVQDNLDLVVSVGCQLENARETVKLAEQYPMIYAAVALHPNDANDYTPALWQEMCQLATHPKVKAIGETGLDYFWDDATPEAQQALFRLHVQLAKDLHKPLVIHDRDAHGDTLALLKETHASEIGGILHAYSGSVEMAQELLKMNFYISLAGPVTFKNANKLLDVAKYVPLNRLLIETDCPYMTPAPFRGRRNEPMYVRHVAEKIAELRGLSYDEVANATYENGKRIFGIA